MKTLVTSLVLASLAGFAHADTFTFQQGQNGYSGTRDTTLFSSDPDFVGGADQEVSIDASDSGSPNNVLLRFDSLFGNGAGQIGAGVAIVSATLTLEITSPGSGIRFFDMLTDWNQATATWNSFGNGIQTDGVEAATMSFLELGANNGDANISDGVLVLDFTAAVQRIQNGTVPGFGWALLPFLPDGTNGVDFTTAEGFPLTGRPLLTINTAPVPEPGTWAMLAAGLAWVGVAVRRRRV